MLRTHNIRFRKLKAYIPFAIAPALLLSATVQVDRLMAQSAVTEFTMPDAVPDGTAIKIDGDNSMAAINTALTEQFAQNFNGTAITAATSGAEPALQAVFNGDIDLAAIGRPLTDEEKAQGLVEIPIARHKIAIFVDPENTYAGDLKITQFGQLFRGEISDWSELGRAAGPIRFVDRPDSSDTRSAFRNYPVFKSAPFETGATADPVSEDTTDAVVSALGPDGIGYAIADQVTNRSDVRIISMHSVMPTDQRYPFSQPLAYVYKGPEANPAVQAFLGYATAPENQEIVEAARKLAATGAPVAAAQSTTTPNTETAETAETVETDAGAEATAEQLDTAAPAEVAPAETPAAEAPAETPAAEAPAEEGTARSEGRGAAGWWPWLLIPAAGGLLWWMLGKGGGVAGGTAGDVIPPVVGDEASRLIMTPRDSQNGYAYWELNERDRNQLRNADNPQLRLYEVNPGSAPKRPSLKMVKQVDCDVDAQDQHISIPTENKAYLTELGYTVDERWQMLARSKPVHVPATATREGVGTSVGQSTSATNGGQGHGLAKGLKGGLAAGATAAVSSAAAKTTRSAPNLAGDVTRRVGGAGITHRAGSTVGDVLKGARPDLAEDDQIILVPRNAQAAYAYWEVSETHKKALREAGGKILKLRIQDVTNIDIEYQPPFSTQEYVCKETDQDRHVPIFVRDRDYTADLGYETEDGRWLRLIRSFRVRVA